MSVGGGAGAKADINMTPMIDVLLVLIIIFHGHHTADTEGTGGVGTPAAQSRISADPRADQRTV